MDKTKLPPILLTLLPEILTSNQLIDFILKHYKSLNEEPILEAEVETKAFFKSKKWIELNKKVFKVADKKGDKADEYLLEKGTSVFKGDKAGLKVKRNSDEKEFVFSSNTQRDIWYERMTLVGN